MAVASGSSEKRRPVRRRRTDDDSPMPEVSLGDLEALQGVVKFPVRIKCATLAWNTLIEALETA